ncbi:regulator of chromosome condensation 1/beta-lactamase-inhibitor protein II, partial [Baffinella frigidus]
RCWGYNYYGQLGRGSKYDTIGDAAGEVASLTDVDLGAGRTVVQLAVGRYHNCALLDNGQLKCWGLNEDIGVGGGQLGLGDMQNRGAGTNDMGANLPNVDLGSGWTIVEIAAGGYHTCARLENGAERALKCWGRNDRGQLGLGDTNNRGDEDGEMGDSLPAVQLGTGRSAVALSLHILHSCALLDDASVKFWGFNGYGALGLGDNINRGDGVGDSPQGNGAGGMGDSLPAVDLGPGQTAVQLASGVYNTCALLDDGRLCCWGDNDRGQLGLNDTNSRGDEDGEMGDRLPAVQLGTGRSAVALALGWAHSCALLDDASVKCWGANYGRLGLGDTLSRGDGEGAMGDSLPSVPLCLGPFSPCAVPACTVSSVHAGYLHTCALSSLGGVRCWGYSGYGQLGRGSHYDTIGDAAGEVASLADVDLGAGRTV